MDRWKDKLEILKHKIRLAKNIKQHLDIICEKNKTEEIPTDKELTKEQVRFKGQISYEKGLIDAVANIPEYKSSEYYQLDMVNRKTKNLDVFHSPNSTGIHGLIHTSALKLAKRRISQILSRLITDIRKEK